MRIDCDDCAMQGTDQCRDCVVSFILEREEGAVVVDGEEAGPSATSGRLARPDPAAGAQAFGRR